jgi:hypothetical protein
MIDPAQLRQWIDSLPSESPIRVAFNEARDAECNEHCNAKTEPGYVPARHAVTMLPLHKLWGLATLAFRFKKLPGGLDCPDNLFDLFANCELAAYGTIEPPIRMEIAPLTASLTSLVTTGLVTTTARDAILAGEVKISPIEAAFDYGDTTTAAQIEEARKL